MIELIGKISILIPWTVGMVVLVQICRKAPDPVDDSNIFNRLRLVWFALTRPDKFVTTFPWLMNDEWDNLK